VKFVIVLARSL